MPISYWKRITGRKTNPVHLVAQRFLQAFLEHGVQASQIPRLMHAIKLDDLKSEESLLAALTPEILNLTAQLLGVRLEWLEGVDDEIYEYLACYKRPAEILEHIAKIVDQQEVGLSFPLRVFSTTKKLDCKDDGQQLLAPVIVEKIADLGEEEIFRYHIYRDEFDWGYFPTRVELKAIAHIVYKRLHTPVPIFVITEKEMRALLDGELIPTNLFRGALITNPSLEDFALTIQESVVAKEVQEIPDVLSYIETENLQNFSFSKAVAHEPPRSTSTTFTYNSPRSIRTGKRASSNQDLWEPVRAVAGALWAEDGLLSIAEVISRIQKMAHLKASAFTASAIRKRIADLAPINIRGKAGRKPKKSP